MGWTLSAIEYLHNKNIVHRDIKPDNILLVGRKSIESVKIWDFGLAKVLESGIEGLTSELCGTLYYKAPEQILECSYSKVVIALFSLAHLFTTGRRHLGMWTYHFWND